MSFSPDLWASVANALIFIALILFPWTTGGGKKFCALIGFGGVAGLLVFDFLAGQKAGDFSLTVDLMTLTVVKAVFFFLCSLLIERVFRALMLRREANKVSAATVDPAAKEKFDREMKSMKERSGKFFGS
jgi:signal transduction histidine kinase